MLKFQESKERLNGRVLTVVVPETVPPTEVIIDFDFSVKSLT